VGVLTVSGSRSSQRERSLAPAPGVTPPPAEPSPHRFLSDVITERRLVEPQVMRAALQASLAGRSLTEILVGNGALSEHDLARTLAEHHGLDHVDLDVFDIDERATGLIDPHVARRLGALPIAFLPDDTVVVALYEPNGSTAAVELAHLTGRTIQPAVASRSQIEAVIRNLPTQRRARMASVPAPADPPVAVAVADDPPPPSPAPVAAAPVQAAPAIEADAGTTAAPVTAATIGAASLGDRGADRLSLQFDGLLETLHQRAEIAERRRGEAEERTAEVQELARAATARADAAEQRAAAAEALVDEAEARTQEMAASVASANDALARLLRACETIEREAQSHGPRVAALQAAHDETCAEQVRREEALRADLETERDELARLEVRLLGELETERGERARLEVALRQARAPDPPVSPAKSQRKLRRVKDPRQRGG
jgi:hypothetical protein